MVVEENEWSIKSKRNCLRRRLNPPDVENKINVSHEVGRGVSNLEKERTRSKNAERENAYQRNVTQDQPEENKS